MLSSKLCKPLVLHYRYCGEVPDTVDLTYTQAELEIGHLNERLQDSERRKCLYDGAG